MDEVRRILGHLAVSCLLLISQYSSAHADSKPEEARAWLKINKNESALATNRFGETSNAQDFVTRLYELGEVKVEVDAIRDDKELLHDEGGPYSDTLVVTLPKDPKSRKSLFEVQAKEVRNPSLIEKDTVQEVIVFWWD